MMAGMQMAWCRQVAGVGAAVLVACAAVWSAVAQAQIPFPARPIRVVVPAPKGSVSDQTARLIAPRLAEYLIYGVLVENRLGDGANLGISAVARAEPDGYMMLLGTETELVYSAGLAASLPFNVEKDLQPVGLVSRSPQVLLVHPGVPAAGLKELVAHARANPGKIAYGATAGASVSRLVSELFGRVTGTQLQPVAFKTTREAVSELAAGRIQIVLAAPAEASAGDLLRKGAVRAYATAGRPRPALRGVLSFADEGTAGFDPFAWTALMVPAATPADMLHRLHRDLSFTLHEPGVRTALEGWGAEPVEDTTPQSAAAFMARERETWVPFIRSLKLQGP